MSISACWKGAVPRIQQPNRQVPDHRINRTYEALFHLMSGNLPDGWVEPLDYERAVVVDAERQRKRTRPLSGVNGEVCQKTENKELTGPALLALDGYVRLRTCVTQRNYVF
jgi:hypothetical protein